MIKSHRMTLVFTLVLIVVVVFVVLVLAQMSVNETIRLPRQDLRVDIRWIKSHRNDEGVVLVDVRHGRDYSRGHLEGSISVPWRSLLNGEGRFVRETASGVVAAAGLSRDNVVVLIGDDDSGGVAFAFWALGTLGYDKARVLLEPLQEVRSAGIAIVKASHDRPPVPFDGQLQPDRIADVNWVVAHRERPGVTLVDVRTFERDRAGQEGPACIPGATALPVPQELWRRNMRGDQAVHAYASSVRGSALAPDAEAVVYGQSAQQAARAYLVLRLMGYERVRLYPGGWSEWSKDATRPVGRLTIDSN